jgi:nucleoside-diphosphate-sugar epimerase
MRKALITGGLGFIGYHLSVRLLSEGFEVDVYDNGSRGRIDAAIAALQEDRRYRLVMSELANDRELGTDYTHIFHLAAVVGVRHVLQDPYRVLIENVSSLANALSFAKRQRDLQRFVFPSTSEVYAGTLQHFGIPIPTPETTPLTVPDLGQPRTSYLLSKIYGEALCHHAELPFTIIRPHNVYGPRMGMAHVVPELLARAHQAAPGGTLVVYSPHHKRTFCYVDDAIELIVRIVTSSAASRDTFNIGSVAEEVSMATLAELVIATVGKPLVVKHGPDTPGSPERRRPDLARAMAVASFVPAVPLEDGVRRTYEWYRARHFDVVEPSVVTARASTR